MNGSTTRWAKGFLWQSQGDDERWQRFFEKVARLARKRIAALGVPCRVFDEEDIAVSVIEELRHMKDTGRIRQLNSGDDLWPLVLSLIATRIANRVRSETAVKRGGVAEVQRIDIHESSTSMDIRLVENRPPDADMIIDDLLAPLDDRRREVVMCRLQGFRIEEIAETLGVSRATVDRELMRARNKWTQEHE